MSTTVRCEIGPAVVRLLGDVRDIEDDAPAASLGAAALAGIDDPLVLVGEAAVSVTSVWREVLRPLLSHAQHAELVHPSWWSPTRCATLHTVAAELVDSAQLVARATVLSGDAATVLVEIGAEQVALSRNGQLVGLIPRGPDPQPTLDEIVRLLAGCPAVRVDAPAGVVGAPVLASMLAEHAAAQGISIEPVRIPARGTPPSCLPKSDVEPQPRPARRWPWGGAAIAGLSITLAIMLWPSHLGVDVDRPPAMTTFVEGRLGVEVPADWTVRRVTGESGSARVEVAAVDQSGAVLHLTQAQVPTSDLAVVAAQLRAALHNESPEVFGDFHPAGQRAGRAAASYQEVRADRVVQWIIVVDNGLRIGIGCQSRPGEWAAVEQVCDWAVRSARRIH